MSLRINVFVFLLATLSIAVWTNKIQKSQDSTKDEAALRQIVQQLQDGWNAHDGKAFAAPFAADADYVIVNGVKIKGREAIEKGHAAIFANNYWC